MTASTAAIQIKSEGTLEDVARKLQEALSLPPFYFDSDQDPPHAITAMNECLGYELWLRYSGHAFELTVEASMDVRDRAEGSFVDVSEWLSKHIGIVTELHCAPKTK